MRKCGCVRRIQKRGRLCVGWHFYARHEYDLYKMGMSCLRELNICTGWGLVRMKGPMKGLCDCYTPNSDYNGVSWLTEPGIICPESPIPLLNQLVIMPDIETLEAFA